MEKNAIVNILKSKNIRVTENRILILTCLSDDTHFHTVKQISKHVGSLNTKSIYNNIKILVSKGLIDTYSFDGISKYAINDHYKDEHNVVHIIDKEQNASHITIDKKIISSIKKEVIKNGYDPSSVKIFVNIKK